MSVTARRAVVLLVTVTVTAAVWQLPSGASHGTNLRFRDRTIDLVDRSGDATIRAELAGIAQKWNSSGAGFTMTAVFGPVDNACVYAAGEIQVCTYLNPSGAQPKGGYADIKVESDKTHIVGGIARMCRDVEPWCYGITVESVRRTLTHEVGHTLALNHQGDPPAGDTCSVMSTTCYSEDLNEHDRQTLQQMYGQPPSSTEGTSFVTSFTPSRLRNDFSGWVGMKLTTGPADVPVSALGRWVVAGNSRTHALRLVEAATGADVPGGSATVATAGAAAAAFRYASLASPVTLRANTTYYLLSQETEGGDAWYNFDTRVVTTGVATAAGYVYSWTGSPNSWNPGGSPGDAFGPVSFLYISPANPV